jgi:hypothetical protein
MKKHGLLGIMLCICIVLTSCTLKTKEDDNTKIVNSVKQIEQYEYNLMSFQITYDEYKKNTKELMVSSYNKDNKVILGYNGKQYKGKDLIGMPLTELKEIGDKVFIEFYGTTKIESCTVDISKVYYNENDSIKFRYVFAKEILKVGNKEMNIYRKYSFLEENNTWKVTVIDEFSAMKDVKIDSRTLSMYTIYDNKPIEYAQTIDMLKK